jgi:hypothetical protein
MVALKLNSSLLSPHKTQYFAQEEEAWCQGAAPKRAKVSPAIGPPTHDAPIPSPIYDDIHIEETGDHFGSIPETNPTAEATAKDVVKGGKASGLSHGPKVDISVGNSTGSLYWKQQQNKIVQLITDTSQMYL